MIGVSFKENRKRKDGGDGIDFSFREFLYKGKGRNRMITVWEIESRDFIFLREEEITICQWQ